MCVVTAVVALGWSPLQALADDGAMGALGSTVSGTTDQVADAVTAASDPVGAVSTAASGTVEAVSDAASGTVEAVAATIPDPIAAASNTVGNVAGAASNTVGSVSNAIGGATSAVGSAAGNVASGALESVGATNETSTATGSTSPPLSSQQAASVRRSSGATRASIHDDLVLLAERGRATAALGDDGSGSCVSTFGTVCVTTTAGDAPGSWEGSVAAVLQKLLALTGSGLLTWVAASCILTVMGALALHETKRRSGEYPLRST